jgi:hypothetical protein
MPSGKTKAEILTQAFEDANHIQREHRVAIGELVRSDYSPEAAKVFFEMWMPFHDASEKLRREYFLEKVAINPESINWQDSVWDWALRDPNRQDIANLGRTHPAIARSIYSTWEEFIEMGKKLSAYSSHDVYNTLRNKHGGKWNSTIGKRLKTNARLKAIEKRVRKEMTPLANQDEIDRYKKQIEIEKMQKEILRKARKGDIQGSKECK